MKEKVNKEKVNAEKITEKMTEKRKRRRKEIVDITLHMMKNMELDDLNVKTLCEKLEISVGTFYYYFETKEELVHEVYTNIDDYLLERIDQRLTHENEEENLIEYANIYANHVKLMGEITGNSLSARPIPLPSAPDEIQKEHTRTLFRVLNEILSNGQKKGTFNNGFDAEEMTEYFIIYMRGISSDWGRRNQCYDIEEAYDRQIKLLIKILK